MGLFTRLKEWASSGDRDQPSDGYIAMGWANLARPPREYWNWVENARDVLINKIVDLIEMCGTVPPQANAQHLCSGLPYTRWEFPYRHPNILDSGETIQDACLGWDWDDDKPVLYVAYDDISISAISVWDYSAAPALSAALPLVFSPVPTKVLSLCSDYQYLYVLYGVAAGDTYVAKFSLSSGSAIAVATVSMGYLYNAAHTEAYKVIVADDGNLGVLMPSNVGFTVTLGVVDKDLTTPQFYDFTTEMIDPKGCTLVSDGTYIYTIGRETAGGPSYDFKIDYLEIADPLTPLSINIVTGVAPSSWWLHPTALQIVGGNVVVAMPSGGFYLFDVTNVEVLQMRYIDFNYATATPFETYGCLLGHDGLNVWFASMETNEGPDPDKTYWVLFKVPATHFCSSEESGSAFPAGLARLAVETTDMVADLPAGRTVFDGHDLWYFLRGGKIFRVTMPGLRS